MPQREVKLGRQLRHATFDRAAADEESRTVPLSFSSEDPYERWWGIEILGHGADEIELDWLAGGTAPLLVDHDTRQQVGVVTTDVSIGADRRGRAVVRFGSSPRAEQEFRDVREGIRANVSVGYEIKELRLEKEEAGIPTYRVTKWRPLEISTVSIPADMTVGIGRAADAESGKPIPVINAKEPRAMPDPVIETKDSPTAKLPTADEVIAAERKRTSEIMDLAARHNRRDLGDKALRMGLTIEQFRGLIADMLPAGQALDTPVGELGLTRKEVQKFSMLRAIMAQVPNSGVKADFELECGRTIADKLGRAARGVFVPSDVLVRGRVEKRDLVVGTASAGGNLVATDLDSASFIELLRNRMMVRQMGARVLSGLVGNLSIPKQTGAATSFWLAENGAPTESQQAVGQVALTPKTVGAWTDFSRLLTLQSSLDVEGMVRDDLTAVLARAVDLAALHGTGASNQPAGLATIAGVNDISHGTNGGAPTWPLVVQYETEVAADNADIGTMGYLTNAQVRGKLKTTEAATGTAVFLWPDIMGATPGMGMLNGYNAGVSQQVRSDLTKGSGTALSAMFFGNWADMIIGEWGVLDLLTDPYTGSTAGTIRVTSFMTVDIAVRNAVSFARALDIITT